MKIASIKSHVLRYDMPEELGYSQQYYAKRTAHLVEITTDEGLTGWGECFGPGTIARANAVIVEQVIAPMVIGQDPMDREVIWHKVYNLLRDHGQKGMPIQALSGVDIALWDLAGKITNLPLCKLIGGKFRTFFGLRQQQIKKDKPNFALSDYVAPKDSGRADFIGGFAVGIHGADEFAKEFDEAHDPYSAIVVKAVADRHGVSMANVACGLCTRWPPCGIRKIRMPSRPPSAPTRRTRPSSTWSQK